MKFFQQVLCYYVLVVLKIVSMKNFQQNYLHVYIQQLVYTSGKNMKFQRIDFPEL